MISMIESVVASEDWGDDVEEVKYFLIILKCGKKMRTQSYVYEEFDGNAILYLQYINDCDPYRDIEILTQYNQ